MDTGSNNFIQALLLEVSSHVNNKVENNFDHFRFPEGEPKLGLKHKIKSNIIKGYPILKSRSEVLDNLLKMSRYFEGLSKAYDCLSDEKSKKCLVSVMAYRILGYDKYKLPVSNDAYWSKLKTARSLVTEESIDIVFQNGKLHVCDLSPIDYPIKMYYNEIGILIDFMLEQYAYKRDGEPVVCVEEGDVVIDCGGCYGDTALYFSHKGGSTGSIYVYEFIPSNLSILRKNLELNPELKDRVTVVPNPVFSKSGLDLFYLDNGPGSRVSSDPIGDPNNVVKTLTIDDLVSKEQIKKVDFIKMDIEGAEVDAIKGARETILKHKPKLAIAVYHSLEEYYTIPELIKSIEPGYKLYLDHFTIHNEETVLFAEYVV